MKRGKTHSIRLALYDKLALSLTVYQAVMHESAGPTHDAKAGVQKLSKI